MKPILVSLFSFLFLFGLAGRLLAETKLLDRIPGDSVLVVSVDDWSDFAEKIEDGPFGHFSKSTAWHLPGDFCQNFQTTEKSRE